MSAVVHASRDSGAVAPQAGAARSGLLRAGALLAVCLTLAACGEDGLLGQTTPVPGAAATAARAAATPIPTPPSAPGAVRTVAPKVAPSPAAGSVRPPTPPPAQPAEAAVASIARALEAQDLAALEAIMLEQVALATPGAEGEVMPRERARAWLAGRLERGVRVQDWRSVEHFGLVEIITGPWPKEPPLASGTVTFNLHRFNQRGQQDDVGGEWRIDVIIAE